MEPIQIAIFAVTTFIAFLNGTAVVIVIKAKAETKNAMATLETKIKDWIRNQGFITREDLRNGLRAFAGEFEVRLIEKLNGPHGFVRKNMCEIVEKNVVADLDQCKEAMRKFCERIERIQQ